MVDEKLIICKDYRLPYFDFGKGKKDFILLPGASMTSILSSEDGIRNLFAPYTEDFHIYVFDVPQDLDSITGIDKLADIIADAALELGIKQADVYGASMGGMIAQKLAISHQSLVRSLTLASSMSKHNDLSRKVFSKWADLSNPEQLAKDMNLHVYSEAFYNANAEVFHALEASATEEGVKRLHNLARMIQDFSSYDELDQIKCPVYVFTSKLDNTLGAQASLEIVEKLGCSIKVYEAYSHALYDEMPGFYDIVFNNLK